MSDAGLARLIVSLEAKLDQYDKSLDRAERKAANTGGKIRNHLQVVDDKFSTLFGHTNPGKALDSVFSRARLNLFEEGAVRIPIFGQAIEELGPIGLGAAAALATLWVTMERSEAAIKFGADVAKLAGQVGVTTDFIQEFNYAAAQSDVDVGAADEALKSLNENLGAVQAGLAKKNLANAFKSIGFTPEQLRGYRDAGELLPVLIQRIEAVGSASERAAIAKKLGIAELLPMINEGAENFARLTARAQELGIVMDGVTVKAMKEAEDKLKEIDQVMKAKANITFAEFADTLIRVKTGFLDAEKAGLRFLQVITNTTPRLQRMQELQGQIADLLGRGAQNEPAGRSLLAAKVKELTSLTAVQNIQNWMGAPKAEGASASDRAKLLVEPGKGSTKKDRSNTGPFVESLHTFTSHDDLDVVRPGHKPVIEADLKPTLEDSGWREAQLQIEQGVHEAWSAGLHALLTGDIWKFLEQRIFESVLTGAADALTKATMEHAGSSFVKFAAMALGIPGFAGGTNSAPGGLAWVGERGPELMNVPRGSQIVPNHQLGGAFGGGTTLIQNHYHLDGAVMADDLWRRIDAGDARAAFNGAQMGHTQTMTALSQRASQRLGR